MIVYEVHLITGIEIRAAFIGWMKTHLERMLEFDGFRRASFMNVIAAQSADFHALKPDEEAWVCQYEVDTQGHLDAYLRDHAPRMRADGPARFGNRMRAVRRVVVPFLLLP